MPYTIDEHKHRFAAWAASRAASTITCRFTVQQGKSIIEAIRLNTIIDNPELLPSPLNSDSIHREWRVAAIHAAESLGLTGFSHGIAAKLINIYLKSVFVCSGHEDHVNVAAIHPPIDSLLLDELHKAEAGGKPLSIEWANARKLRWSKFNSVQYETLILAIKNLMQDRALWKVESFWRGYQ